jgi:hypothetical protein
MLAVRRTRRALNEADTAKHTSFRSSSF